MAPIHKVNCGPARARLVVEAVGKGVAQNQENLGSNSAHTTYQLCDPGQPASSL